MMYLTPITKYFASRGNYAVRHDSKAEVLYVR